MKCELQPSLLPVQLHGPEQMQVQVLVQVPKPLLLPEMVLLVELVPVSMPNPPVDQTDPLTQSVPNPQLDQTELLPLSVLEQLPVLDPSQVRKLIIADQTRSLLSRTSVPPSTTDRAPAPSPDGTFSGSDSGNSSV